MPAEMKGVANGLGMAGSAVGGVAGIAQMVHGFKTGDSKTVVAGAADMTTAAASLAALGVIGGAAVLGPASGMLLSVRGLHRMKHDDRSTRLNGATDLVSAAAVTAKMAGHVPWGVTLGIGGGATILGALRGLESIHQAHAQNRRSLLVRGVGELVTTTGIVGIAAGAGLVPGIGLIVGGAMLPLLRRIKPLRATIDKGIDATDRLLSPVARVSDRAWKRMDAVVTPASQRVERALRPVGRPFRPLLAALAKTRWRVRGAVMSTAGKGVAKLSGTRVSRALDKVTGLVNRLVLPETEEPLFPPQAPVSPAAPPPAAAGPHS